MRVLTIFILNINFLLSFGQGGCNVKYFNVNELDVNFINKKVIIDFHGNRSVKMDSIINSHGNRKWFHEDTLFLTINDRKYKFIEYRSVGVDGCSYIGNGIKYSNNLDTSIRIEEVKVLNMLKDSILFEFELVFQNEKNKTEIKNKKLIQIWLLKNTIDGFITRKKQFYE